MRSILVKKAVTGMKLTGRSEVSKVQGQPRLVVAEACPVSLGIGMSSLPAIRPFVDVIYIKKFAQKIGAAKKRGNNMKTPFLGSFCPFGFRSVVRFSPKNLVPEIINWLALVVRNCTLGV
jgi:hypothetical protein